MSAPDGEEPSPQERARARRFAVWCLVLRARGALSFAEVERLEAVDLELVVDALEAVEADEAERLTAAVARALRPPEAPAVPLPSRAQLLARAGLADARR